MQTVNCIRTKKLKTKEIVYNKEGQKWKKKKIEE